MYLLRWLFNQFVMYEGEPGIGGSGGNPPAFDPGAARTMLSDFLPADTVKTMDDNAVKEHHTRFSGAIGKHYKPSGPWYGEVKDPATRDWITAYGGAYPNAESLISKARNLEQFIGADKAQRGVIIPKPDAKPEEWAAFWQKAGGVPKTADGYPLPKGLEKDPIVAKFRDHAFKTNMPMAHWKDTAAWIAAETENMQNQQTVEFGQKAEQEMTAVQQAWGNQYDEKTAAGQRAAAALIPHESKEQLQEVLHKMEGALGTKFTMEFWANLGERMGEHGFISGGAPNGGEQTPEAAKAEIRVLQGDKEFAKKVANGDADATAKWNRLHQIAFAKDAQPIQ